MRPRPRVPWRIRRAVKEVRVYSQSQDTHTGIDPDFTLQVLIFDGGQRVLNVVQRGNRVASIGMTRAGAWSLAELLMGDPPV